MIRHTCQLFMGLLLLKKAGKEMEGRHSQLCSLGIQGVDGKDTALTLVRCFQDLQSTILGEHLYFLCTAGH
jgi:hypothetical protein